MPVRGALEAHIPRGERNPLPHDLELSKTAREALVLAEVEADKLGHQDIRNEHILLGVIESGNSFAAKLLAREGVSPDHIRREIESPSPELPKAVAIKAMTGFTKAMSEMAEINNHQSSFRPV